MNEEIKQCFDFDNSFIEPNWDLRNCFVEKNKTYPLEFTEEYLENIEVVTKKQVNTIKDLQKQNKELKDNWNKLKEWLEEEKIRLARECSNIYEDGLGKTKLVNEDIYNELNNVLDKMEEIEGGMNECI